LAGENKNGSEKKQVIKQALNNLPASVAPGWKTNSHSRNVEVMPLIRPIVTNTQSQMSFRNPAHRGFIGEDCKAQIVRTHVLIGEAGEA
jgi:hypothetical protein